MTTGGAVSQWGPRRARATHGLHDLAARLAGRPEAAWEWIERLQDAEPRPDTVRTRGAVPTPRGVAARMAARLLATARAGETWRVLDAGCGTGRLLLEVVRAAEKRGVRVHCEGVEIDPVTARRAQALSPLLRVAADGTLAGWRVRSADFLLDRMAGDPVDAAIANPPYVPLRHLDAAMRARLQAAYGVGTTDLAALFLERLLDRLRPGGRLSVIVPNKLLACGYARALRRRLLVETSIEVIWDLSAVRVFAGRGSYPVVLVLRRQPPSRRHRVQVRGAAGTVRARWPQRALELLPDAVLPLDMAPELLPLATRLLAGPRLGDAVRVRCGIARSGFGRAVGSGPERIVRSGDVRPFRVRGDAPFAPARAGIDAAALAGQRCPKVLVPGLFRRLAAAYDGHGRLVGRVYFVPAEGGTARERDERRVLLLALLNSRLFAVLYAALFGSTAQSGRWLRANGPYLECLPWPARPVRPALAQVVRALERRPGGPAFHRLDLLVESLFGLVPRERALLGRLEAELPPRDDLPDSSRPVRRSGKIPRGERKLF